VDREGGAFVTASTDPTTPARVQNDRAARIAVAQATLAVHQMCVDTGYCEACQRECPCEDANDAFNTLADFGVPIRAR
jgi:hypothetical protein